MGAKINKRMRKIAEKTTKIHAFELAKQQIMEITNAPFLIRWRFCKAILFPKRIKLTAEEREKIHKAAYGGIALDAAAGEALNAGN
jgi:hypothetical protein